MSPEPPGAPQPDEPGMARSILQWLWNNKEWLARKFAEIRAWLSGGKKGQSGILIIGPGGRMSLL